MQIKPLQSTATALIIIASLTLGGCATDASSKKPSSRKTQRSSLPKVPPKVVPGGTGDNWRYLGTSKDQLIADEINESSISLVDAGKQLNRYQDRKTIVNTAQFNYNGITPNYKYSLSWWKIDCLQKQYLIDSTTLYDAYGKLIKQYSLNSNQWSQINADSIAQLQYNYVCQGINRGLGY